MRPAFFDLVVVPFGAGRTLGDETMRVLAAERGSETWPGAMLSATGISFRLVFDDLFHLLS
jgi:hypothetical protein